MHPDAIEVPACGAERRDVRRFVSVFALRGLLAKDVEIIVVPRISHVRLKLATPGGVERDGAAAKRLPFPGVAIDGDGGTVGVCSAALVGGNCARRGRGSRDPAVVTVHDHTVY